MRKLFLFGLSVVALTGAACSNNAGDCNITKAACAGAGGSGGGGNGDNGGGGSGPACDFVDGAAVATSCGVFVKAGGSGDGSLASPLGDVQAAADAAKTHPTKTVIICGSDVFAGSVVVEGGVSIIGGVAC